MYLQLDKLLFDECLYTSLIYIHCCYCKVLAKLEKFKSGIAAKSNKSASDTGDTKDEDLSDWKTVRLKFAPDHGKVRLLCLVATSFIVRCSVDSLH